MPSLIIVFSKASRRAFNSAFSFSNRSMRTVLPLSAWARTDEPPPSNAVPTQAPTARGERRDLRNGIFLIVVFLAVLGALFLTRLASTTGRANRGRNRNLTVNRFQRIDE